jgi:quercetin dioxygenase-like cupin family protein
MNVKDLFDPNKEVSTKVLFQSNLEKSNTIGLKIRAEGLLKEHISKTPALLICVAGDVVYRDEKGAENRLKAGDLQEIEPMVKHEVKGLEDSLLVLCK